MNRFTTLLTIVLLIGIAGCECHYEQCGDYQIALKLSGFDSVSLQQIIISYYEAGSNFSSPIGRDTIREGISYYRQNGIDTSLVFGGVMARIYDYEISFPNINKKVQLTNIRFTTNSQKVCGGFFSQKISTCYNQPYSYTIDGQTYTSPNAGFERITIQR